MVVADDVMPKGHEWVIVDLAHGHTVVWLSASGAVRERSEPITVHGTTFQVIDNRDLFDWEWCRIQLCDGSERILWNRESAAFRVGYARCADDGTPMSPLRLVS